MSLGTDIYSMFLQGRQAAMQNLKNADEIAKEQKKEHIRGLWSKWEALTAPQFDKDGKPIARTTADIVADPRALELINDPIFKDLRTRNTKAVDAPIVGFKKLDETGNQVVPIIRQQYEDGTSSTGPLTADRSTRGDAQVMGIQANDIHNIIASELYPIDPDEGFKAQARIQERAKFGVVSAYRHAKDDNERAQILDAASQYYDPTDIIKSAAGPARVADYEKGGWIVDSGMGTKSFVEDPVIAEQGKKLKAQSLKDALDVRTATKESDLTFDEKNNDRQLKLDADKITNQYETQLRNKLAHSEDELRLESARIVNNYVTNLGLDKQYAGEKLKLLTEEIIARVKATAGANYEAAPTVKKTNDVLNPVPAQDEKGLLQAREILNPSAVPTLLSKGEAVADQTVLDWAPKLTTNDLQGLYAGLARAYQNGNPAAAKPLESVRRILHDAAADKTEGGKSETFKPAKFSYDLMSNAIKGSGLGEDALTVARPQMMQKVGRLAQDFGISDDNEVLKSQAHLAALDAYQLEHDQDDVMFKGRAYSNAEGPMFLRRYIESTGIKSVGESPREFMDRIYTPIVNETGLNITDPKQRNDLLKLTALASSVMDNGVDRDDAVATVISLTKDPAKAARAAEAMKGDSESARISSMGQALASEIKTRRQNSMKSTLREGADFTFGGGMWR